MLQSINKSLIIEHRFIISFFFLFDLLHEKFFLNERIIEFGIGICEFMVLDEELESFGKSRFGSMVFGKRRHHLRMLDDEGRVETLTLKEFAD